MLSISRRCVPFTPFEKDLAAAVVTLVSATGVYAPGQEPFPTEDPGDISYRVIAGDADVGVPGDHAIADVARILGRERLLAGGVDAGRGDQRHDRRGQVFFKGSEGNTTTGDRQHYSSSRNTSMICELSGASPMS